MKLKLPFWLLGLVAAGPLTAQSLYDVGTEAQESMPLKWVVGANLVYDDNVSPGFGPKEDSLAFNPYVGATFVSITPQTTWDVYARIGCIYYFDEPPVGDDFSSQSRAGVNFVHRFSERLRFSSRNFIAYELEPDYSYGYASSRVVGEYFYWQTDNSLGYRWTERFATYTGVRIGGYDYADVANNDRIWIEPYVQGRYQLTPQTVLTADYRYRYTEGDGVSSDYSDHYLLGGVEHRFSPNTVGILRAGAQFHDVDGGDNSTSPYVEFALTSQVNSQFRVRSYARYGIENYDTVQFVAGTIVPGAGSAGLVEFDDRQTLRFGVSGEYAFSPMFSMFSGIDYIPTSYGEPRSVSTPPFVGGIGEFDEDIFNAYIGLSVKFTDYLYGNASYNYTNSSSDLAGRDYDRNRFSVGVSAEF